MRDFKSGDIHGDVSINDNGSGNNNTNYKPLDQCDNLELYSERTHREKLIAKETRKKYKDLKISLLALVFALAVISVWLFFSDQMHMFTFITGMAAFFFGAPNFIRAFTPSEFEQRQEQALREINMLIKERDIC